MIALAATAISMIPNLVNLFTSDDKSKAVSDLTSTVIKGASKALGIDVNSKEDVLKHIAANPKDAAKLTQLNNDFKLEIEKLGIKELELQLEDKSISAEMFMHDNSIQKNMVKHIHFQFYFIVVVGVTTLFLTAQYIPDKGLAMALSAFVSGLVTLITNRVMSLDGFFFGSSLGSKEKDKKTNPK